VEFNPGLKDSLMSRASRHSKMLRKRTSRPVELQVEALAEPYAPPDSARSRGLSYEQIAEVMDTSLGP